jgi:hypothetical protein
VNPLALDEIVDLDAYEPVREAFRARVQEAKRARRVGVGDRVTLLFENRETVRFQVQEMMRVERIRTPERVQHELDVYNELVPGPDELSATMFIEITDSDRIRAELDLLLGIDACVYLELGAERIRARFDDAQLEEDRISAVHYLRFALPPGAAARLADAATPARLAIDHARYRHATELSPALRASLAADLAGDPPPLLVPPPGASVAAANAPLVSASGRVRVRRADVASGRGHVVVEPVEPVAAWADAPAALEAELLGEVRRVAGEVQARFGACRVVCDLHAPAWRWHVFAPESR